MEEKKILATGIIKGHFFTISLYDTHTHIDIMPNFISDEFVDCIDCHNGVKLTEIFDEVKEVINQIVKMESD